MDDSFKKAVRAVSDAFSTKQNVIEWKPATLGDGHGTVSTGNNMVYCRLSDNSSVIEVLNLRVQPVDGLRVRIGKLPEMPLVWQVLGQDDQRVDENGQDSGGGGVYNTPLHHRTHEYLGSDQVNLDWRQITTLRVYAYSGFSIGVLAGLIPRTGGDLVVATQTLDLSSHVPASGALYCLITVDASGLLDTTDGTTIDSLANLALTDIPDTPAGHFRLAAIRLYAGQSAINESRNSNDVRDLRWPQENVAGSAGALFGTQTSNTIFAGPASGAAALPTFRSGVTDDIASGVFPLARGGTNADNATDAINNLLPSQSGQAGNVLTTDGANVSWGAGGGGSGSITIASLPVGTIAAFGGSSIPSGWLECNGAAVSRTTYSDLFTAIGTTYGVGDGSTTFNLPDLRGRTSIGKGTGSGLSARTIGATGGEETHTLTTTEIPSHTHSIPSRDATAGGAHADTVPSVTSTGLDTTTYTNAAGSGGAHNNMQPFLVTAWIIKYTDTATSAIIFSDAEGDPADVTLARADGTSIYAARRDHAHAVDVSIAPTWTGAHTHTQSLTVRGDGAAPGFANTLYWTSAQGPAFAGYRARGSLASPAAVQDTDVMARFSGRGFDGSTFEVSAPGRMDVVASETHGASAAGTRIEFYTTPNASTTIGLAATIGQDKSLSVVGAFSASNYSGTVSGGGTLATGGFTLTVPATGTAALLGVANTFTHASGNTFNYPITIGTASIQGGFTIPSTTAGHGPNSLNTNIGVFNGTNDPMLMFGYNLTTSGTRITVGDAGIALGIEGDYNDGSRRLVEMYCHVLPVTGSTFYRPFAFTLDRDDPTQYIVGQILISGTAGIFDFIRASDNTSLMSITSNGGGAVTIAGVVSIGGATTLKNSSNMFYRATGDVADRYSMGISGSGGFQFQSLDAGTPRSFSLVSSGGASKFLVGFETGDTTISGNTTIQGTGLSSVSGRLQVNGRIGIGRDPNAAFVLDAYNGISNFGRAGADGTYNEVIRLSIASLPTQYTHQINATASGGGLALNGINIALCDNTASGHVEVLRMLATGSILIGTATDGMTAGGSLAITKDLAHRGTKAGFYNTTPITQPANTVAINDVLVNLGLRASGGESNFSTRTTYPGTYAAIHVHDASTAQNVATGTTYVKITAFTDNGFSNNCTPDAANDKITITKAGLYRVVGSVSFADDTNNVTWFASVFLNGTEQDQIHFTRKIGTAGDVGNAALTGIIDVTTVPWDLDLRMRHDASGTVAITVSYANLNIEYVGET